MRALDVAGSFGTSLIRLAAGQRVERLGPRPSRPLELYDFEGCPFCRKVREAMTALDLDPLIYPCPKGGQRFRPELRARGGKEQFPYLVDPDAGVEMYESDAIVRHLFESYGAGAAPLLYRANPLFDLAGGLGSLLRLGAGVRARRARPAERPLVLYSFEASPYCRLVRETLCELELPYRLHNLGTGSPKRLAFRERTGKMQVPHLEDPNTGRAMFESAEIQRYLLATYAL
jgi:glutathione S-transferase